jgi:hypothetical protein
LCFSVAAEPPAPVDNTAQPWAAPQPILPPAYGQLDHTLNQQHVQQVRGERFLEVRGDRFLEVQGDRFLEVRGDRFLEVQRASMPITAYPPPHSFLGLVIISLIICAFLNPISLGLGIPALILSSLSFQAKAKNQWKKAEGFGRIAFYLTMANWIYVYLVVLLAGSSTSLILIKIIIDLRKYY